MTEQATALPQIFTAMAAVMGEVEAIGKDQVNQGQKFKYRGIDQVYNALQPLMAKHKIFLMPEVLDNHTELRTNANNKPTVHVSLRMKYTFWTVDGSSVSCVVQGEAMDNGDKATNKAMAVAHKYALLQTFMIPTEDMQDPDASLHELANEELRVLDDTQKTELRTLMEKASTDEAKFCEWAGFPSINVIPNNHFEPLKKALIKKINMLAAEGSGSDPQATTEPSRPAGKSNRLNQVKQNNGRST